MDNEPKSDDSQDMSKFTLADVSHFTSEFNGSFTPNELRAFPEGKPFVSRVVWKDGTSSWAKSWMRWDEVRQTWVTTLVGAGAYGNLTLWSEQR